MTRTTMAKTRLYRSTGLLGVAVLALAACGDDPEDTTVGDENPDDTAQEDVDPDGAEDQGDTPGEIADEEDEEPEPEEDEEDDDAPAGDAPALAEIEEQLWENSASQDSVTITAEVPAALFGLDGALEDGEEEDLTAEDTEVEDSEAEVEDSEAEQPAGEPILVTVGGDMAGNGSVWEMEGLSEYLLFDNGETVYQPVDSFISEYRALQPDDAAGPDADELETALQAEGTWIDMTLTSGGEIETPQQFVEDFRSEMLASAGVSSLAELEIQGETETRDGQEVWVYREEDNEAYVEFVILAEADTPLLHSISMDVEEVQMDLSFTGWNESEDLAEDEPEEEDTITDEELNAIGESLM